MKNSKKLIALVLAMVMIFALTASALAATDSTNAVTVTVQIYKRSSSGMTGFGNRSVTLTGSNPTVYDAVQTISNDASYTKLRNAAWIDVPITDANGNATNEIGKALVYLTAERSSYNSQYVLTICPNTSPGFRPQSMSWQATQQSMICLQKRFATPA